jgi:Vam6/Vps39-like protein vacuolar protein sorting-associated protein 39
MVNDIFYFLALTQPFQERRLTQIRTLHAISLFSDGNFDEAINTFIELDINPAKVVALYPDSIAGRLSTPREKWFELHGGRPPPNFVHPDSSNVTSPQESLTVAMVETPEQPGGPSARNASGSFRGKPAGALLCDPAH